MQNLFQQLRVPTEQEAQSDRRVSKRHKPNPCHGSPQQDTGRVKQIITYEYHSPNKILSRGLRLVLVISHPLILTGLRPSQHMNFGFQTVYKTYFTRNGAIHNIKPSIYSEYTSLLSHCFRNVVRSIELKHRAAFHMCKIPNRKGGFLYKTVDDPIERDYKP